MQLDDLGQEGGLRLQVLVCTGLVQGGHQVLVVHLQVT
jgi:hypothetical protein